MVDAQPNRRQPDEDRQLAAAHALAEMLAAADAAKVPPVTWTIAPHGRGLYGHTDCPGDMPPQATLEAWVRHLGLAWAQATPIDGRKQLRAVGVCPSNPDVLVEIVADLERDPPTHSRTEEGDSLWNAEGTPWH